MNIFSTALNGKYSNTDGTSFATPYVSAAAALIWAMNPEMTAEDVIRRMLSTVRHLPGLRDKVLSGGTLDIMGALGLGGACDSCPFGSECLQIAGQVKCGCGPAQISVNGRCMDNRSRLKEEVDDDCKNCSEREICEISQITGRSVCVCSAGFWRNDIGSCVDRD